MPPRAQNAQNVPEITLEDILEAINAIPTTITATGTSFVFPHPTVSSVWVISHNLGYNPLVRVITSDDLLVEGDIDYQTPDILSIYFSIPISGTVYLT